MLAKIGFATAVIGSVTANTGVAIYLATSPYRSEITLAAMRSSPGAVVGSLLEAVVGLVVLATFVPLALLVAHRHVARRRGRAI